MYRQGDAASMTNDVMVLLPFLHDGGMTRAAAGSMAQMKCRPGHDHVAGHLFAGFLHTLALAGCMPSGAFSQCWSRAYRIHSAWTSPFGWGAFEKITL